MDLKDLILSLLVFSPLLLVWVFGIVFAVSRWNNHPKVSKLVVIASILIFVHFAASQFWNAWIVPQLIHSDLGQTQLTCNQVPTFSRNSDYVLF